MREFRAKLNTNGRVVIPALCRKMLDLKPGEDVIISVNGREARLFAVKHAVTKAQAEIKQYAKGVKSLSDELIKIRREEAKRDSSGY